jgi:hypothetical protein
MARSNQPKAAPKSKPKTVAKARAAKVTARKEKSATARGFESVGAARSVQNQYGLVKQEDGSFKRPTMDWFTAQMETAGYGPQFQALSTNEAGTPVSIGGARWMMGKNGLQFTGQASDLAGGNAYTDENQVAYVAGKHPSAKRGRKAGGKKTGAQRSEGVVSPLAGEGGTAANPYAEADVATTSYLRAQGKAYAAGKVGGGAYSKGGTGTPDDSAVVEDAAGGGGGKKKTKKQKANLKVRGKRKESGVRAGSHIAKSGKVVANRGGKKAGKNSGR